MLVKGCWEAFNSLSPQQQLSAANQLCRSNLGAAVNPSAYFRKILTRVRSSSSVSTKFKSKQPQTARRAHLQTKAYSIQAQHPAIIATEAADIANTLIWPWDSLDAHPQGARICR